LIKLVNIEAKLSILKTSVAQAMQSEKMLFENNNIAI